MSGDPIGARASVDHQLELWHDANRGTERRLHDLHLDLQQSAGSAPAARSTTPHDGVWARLVSGEQRLELDSSGISWRRSGRPERVARAPVTQTTLAARAASELPRRTDVCQWLN